MILSVENVRVEYIKGVVVNGKAWGLNLLVIANVAIRKLVWRQCRLRGRLLTPKGRNHFGRMPRMTIDEVLTILENKVFHKAVIASLSELTSKDQIIAETKWTDCLQNLVDFGNKRLLRNFSLRLEMDDCEPEIHRQCIYSEKEVNQ